jgi:hypothetical protein
LEVSTTDLINKQQLDLIKEKTNENNGIAFSKEAPKGKGILARI